MNRRHAHPPKRQHHAVDQERILSADEKRGLILAHAEARKSRQVPHGRFAYYIGIAASCLIVATGWWLSLGSAIPGKLFAPNADDQRVLKSVQTFGKDMKSQGQDMQRKIEQAKAAYEKDMFQQQMLKDSKDQLKQMSTSTNSKS